MPAFQSFFTDHGDQFMPFPENTPTPDDLPSLSAAEIAALPVELLAILQREIDERLKRDKAAKTHFDAGLAVRYATRAAEERQAAGKDTGTVRFDDGDFPAVADLPKRVDWDQDRLATMVARIRDVGDDPAEYVDLAYKVTYFWRTHCAKSCPSAVVRWFSTTRRKARLLPPLRSFPRSTRNTSSIGKKSSWAVVRN